MPWTERAEHYRFKANTEQISGTRGYRWAADGTATLPTLGTSTFTDNDGTNYPSCVCVEFEERFADPRAGNDDFPDRVYKFATPDTSGTDNPNKDADIAAKNIRTFGGVETVTIESPEAQFKWEDGAQEDCEVPLYRNIITGSVVRTVYDVGEAQYDQYLLKLNFHAGTLNNDPIFGLKTGQVMFNSWTGSLYYDQVAEAYKYQFDLEFLTRRINDGWGVPADSDWLYLFDDISGRWRIPVRKPGGTQWLSFTDHFQLFTVP